MRVLAIIPGPNDWASAIFTRQMASLELLGCRVEMFFLQNRTRLSAVWRERVRLQRHIATFQPDLLHAHFGTVTGFLTATASGLPLVVSFRGTDLNPAGPDDGIIRLKTGHLLSQVTAMRADRIVCVSEQLRRRLWTGQSRATIIPTGVNTRLFSPMPQGEARKRLGWSAADRVVLFSATAATSRNKGLDLVAAAMELVRARVPDIRLEIMDGSVDPEDVPLLMNAADCLAFASAFEGSPNVVKEAAACGLPVVTVDAGDVREVLEAVAPGAIVPRDARLMADALVCCLLSRRRSNGPSRIERLSLERTAAELLRVYRSAVGAPESART